MERIFLSVLFFIVFTNLSCNNTNTSLLTFKHFYNRNTKYSVKIPKGYEEKRYRGDHEYQQEYWFQDSSVFFVTTFENTLNYESIREQGTYYDRFEAFRNGDTITLEGKNERGLSWKDKLMEDGLTIGYSNVSSNRLAEFEAAMSSIKKRR